MIGGGFAINPNVLPDNVGIAAEIASPDFVPQNRDLFRARLVILGSEIAAQEWRHADDFEEILRDISRRYSAADCFCMSR